MRKNRSLILTAFAFLVLSTSSFAMGKKDSSKQELPSSKNSKQTETQPSPQSKSQSAYNDGFEDDFFGEMDDLESLFDFFYGDDREKTPIYKNGKTVETRIGLPEGYERVAVKSGSYEDFYRKLPLKADGTPVYYYNGKKKETSFHVAVFDFPQPDTDILQCADACMKMRAEYFYSRGEYDKIGFTSEGGVYMPFSKYMEGYRLTASGWKGGYAKGSSREIFDQYLRIVYTYASTRSMAKEVQKVSINDIRIGDVFIVSGNPGHAVFVVDLAVNKKTGKKIALLGQSYMPAQDIHIVKGFEPTSPWIPLDSKAIGSMEFTFTKENLARWP